MSQSVPLCLEGRGRRLFDPAPFSVATVSVHDSTAGLLGDTATDVWLSLGHLEKGDRVASC